LLRRRWIFQDNKLPAVLVLHLKRFNSGKKIERAITFDQVVHVDIGCRHCVGSPTGKKNAPEWLNVEVRRLHRRGTPGAWADDR